MKIKSAEKNSPHLREWDSFSCAHINKNTPERFPLGLSFNTINSLDTFKIGLLKHYSVYFMNLKTKYNGGHRYMDNSDHY